MKICVNQKIISIKICSNFFNRLIGMMFNKKKLSYGLFFKDCYSIHTFFMFQNIDVIFIDKDFTVIKVFNNVKPYHVISCKHAYGVFEFSKDIIDIKTNDKINVIY